MTPYRMRSNNAFTLAEVLIVLTILLVLTTIAIPRMGHSIEKSRVAEGLQILNTIRQAQLAREFELGAYGANLADLDIVIPTPDNFNQLTNAAIHPLTNGYLATVTRTGGAYALCIQPDGDIFCDNIIGNPCLMFNFQIEANCP